MNTGFLDVPFLPDPDFVDFLQTKINSLQSIHYSLYSDYGLDGRHSFESYHCSYLSALLSRLQTKGLKKYLLLNSRFLRPDLYQDSVFLSSLVDNLALLLADNNIAGIIYNDHYFLLALANFSPDVSCQLEAVPGINSLLDSPSKVQALLGFIDATSFKLPGKLILDRSLNRSLDRLERVIKTCRDMLPNVRLELLANEGCLLHCPFKLTHDAQIAYANTGSGANVTHKLNNELGCMRILGRQPELLFQSPFIRPEDVDFYLDRVDCIKLCGRTLGASFLQRCITAYDVKSYNGNLLDLFDTMEWLAASLEVSNEKLPASFLQTMLECGLDCSHCGRCRDLLARCSRDLAMQLPDLRIS